MKQLLIPVLIAILAGVGGGSGFAYMRTTKAFVADSTQRADSIKSHPPAKVAPTTAHADSVQAPGIEAVPMTPADSIRALEAARAGTHGAVVDTTHAKVTRAPESTPKPTASTEGSAKPSVPANAPSVATADLADMVRAARNEAMSTALPEQRLAKIFAAMSPKDAAKVMEQMPDSDVRSILALMSDRSAAAVLTQFPPARAATITNGASKAPGKTP